MRNTLLEVWVKNVYNPLFLRTIEWKTSEAVSPTPEQDEKPSTVTVNISALSHSFITSFTPVVSTSNFIKLPLFNTYFYPLSTAPIINPKKKMKKGNT